MPDAALAHDKASRLQLQKLDAPVCKKRKEMQLELDEANQKAEILKAQRDAELAHADKAFKQDLAHRAEKAKQELEIANAERDSKLKHSQQVLVLEQAAAQEKADFGLEVKRKEADLDVEIIKKKAVMEEDTKERRSQQQERLLETEARLEALTQMFIPLGTQPQLHRIQVQDW